MLQSDCVKFSVSSNTLVCFCICGLLFIVCFFHVIIQYRIVTFVTGLYTYNCDCFYHSKDGFIMDWVVL